MIDDATLARVVRAALEEDIGSGDLTSRTVVPEETCATGRIVARQELVVAGLPVAREVFRQVDTALQFHESCEEGARLGPGGMIARIEGPARAILAAERTALNFLQRMCGIATATRRMVDAAGRGVQIADTRKTAPGLRAFDKYAVRTGGGTNHRAGLYDAVLIKDNHWRLVGGVGPAVRRARQTLSGGGGTPPPIEVEVSTLAEVEEALAAGADALLLDNMDLRSLERAVRAARGRAFLEVSGGVREEDLPTLSRLGIDRISIGMLTHSVRAADVALEVEGR